jgi:hypothetical protein
VFELAPNLEQSKDVFKKMKEDADTLVRVGPHQVANVRGFEMTDGNLQTDLVGVIPFETSGVSFNATSCAKSLHVRVAIANWCTKSQNTSEDNRVDVWMGHITAAFNDADVVSIGFWPTLIIDRDLVNNPLPAGCDTGYDVAVEPSDADIDAHLPIGGYWPRP